MNVFNLKLEFATYIYFFDFVFVMQLHFLPSRIFLKYFWVGWCSVCFIMENDSSATSFIPAIYDILKWLNYVFIHIYAF